MKINDSCKPKLNFVLRLSLTHLACIYWGATTHLSLVYSAITATPQRGRECVITVSVGEGVVSKHKKFLFSRSYYCVFLFFEGKTAKKQVKS